MLKFFSSSNHSSRIPFDATEDAEEEEATAPVAEGTENEEVGVEVLATGTIEEATAPVVVADNVVEEEAAVGLLADAQLRKLADAEAAAPVVAEGVEEEAAVLSTSMCSTSESESILIYARE